MHIYIINILDTTVHINELSRDKNNVTHTKCHRQRPYPRNISVENQRFHHGICLEKEKIQCNCKPTMPNTQFSANTY